MIFVGAVGMYASGNKKMKRSEGIKLLQEILLEAQGHLAEEINVAWLLDKIEYDLGMQAPKRIWPLHEILTPTLPMMSNTWEPENE